MIIKYWLIKSEPDVFSIDDPAGCLAHRTHCDGVCNYQARNYMRDEMKTGDCVIFFHCGSKQPADAGICEVVI